jgi:hypothetical protein
VNDSRFRDFRQRMPVCTRIGRTLLAFVVCFSLLALLASAPRAQGGPGVVGGSFTVSEVRAYIPFVAGHYPVRAQTYYFPFAATHYRAPGAEETPLVQTALSRRAKNLTATLWLSPVPAPKPRPAPYRVLMSALDSVFGLLGIDALHPCRTAAYHATCSEP